MRLENGEIECSFLWRPGFSEVNPKLRIAYFKERLVVTKFDDENEYSTNGLTAFMGPTTASWRDVVRAVADEDVVVCYVDDWIAEPGLVNSGSLLFSSAPNIPMEIVGLAWLGQPYSELALSLLKVKDDDLAQIAGSKGPLRDCISAIVEGTRDLDWPEAEEDVNPSEVMGQALEALVKGGDFMSKIRLE